MTMIMMLIAVMVQVMTTMTINDFDKIPKPQVKLSRPDSKKEDLDDDTDGYSEEVIDCEIQSKTNHIYYPTD